MGLNITSQGGDFDPYVKYNAKAGRWYVKQGDGEVEVQNPVFVADFENIKTGWFYFRAGSAPEKVFDVSLSQPAPKPDRTYTDDKGVMRDCFKRGFELRLFSKNSFGGIVVLNGASMHLNNAINTLYEQFEAGKLNNPNLLPVVKFTGTTPMKDKAGTNYFPNFVIDKWVARPNEFDVSNGGQQAAIHAVATSTPQQVAATIAAPVAQAVSEF
jgi:hypothetical protein